VQGAEPVGLRLPGTGVEHMSRQMNDGPDNESGKRLFLWYSRYVSLRHPCSAWSGPAGGDMRQVLNTEDW